MDSDLTPGPDHRAQVSSVVKDDPTKPFKTYAAVISAFLASFLLTSSTLLPAWAVGVVTALIAALAVYLTPNPKTVA